MGDGWFGFCTKRAKAASARSRIRSGRSAKSSRNELALTSLIAHPSEFGSAAGAVFVNRHLFQSQQPGGWGDRLFRTNNAAKLAQAISEHDGMIDGEALFLDVLHNRQKP